MRHLSCKPAHAGNNKKSPGRAGDFCTTNVIYRHSNANPAAVFASLTPVLIRASCHFFAEKK